MTNLDHESSNQHLNLVQSLTSQLQVLGNENRTLMQERQSFEAIIKKYVGSMNDLEQQLAEKNTENSQIVQKNKDITVKCRKLQLDCQRITQDYTFLYNYVHTGKRGPRDLLIKEMELNNKLNQIQQEGHLTIVQQLRESLDKKNEDIRGLLGENGKLKRDIFSISFQYNEKISNLREEIAALKGEKSLGELPHYQQTSQQQINEVSRKKIEGLQSQIKLFQREYKLIEKQLLSCKQQLNHQRSQAEWLKEQQETRGLRNDLVFDFQSMKQLLDENEGLKKEVEQERYRLSSLIQRDPSVLAHLDTINVSNPFDSLHEEIEELSEKLGESNKEIILLRAANERLTNQNKQRDDDYFILKIKTIKVVEKLTNYISNYVPCFNIYGFTNFALDEEQSKLIQDHSTGIEKEIDKIGAELILKNKEIRNLESKLKESQRKLKEKDERIQIYIEKGDKMKEQNEKLLSTVEMLTKRLNSVSVMCEQNIRNNVSDSERRMEQYRSEHEDIEQITPRQFSFSVDQSRPKSQLLKELVQSLQKDRTNMLNIIRAKDLLLAESNAELSVFRAQIKPKFYQFQTPNFSKFQISSKVTQAQQPDQILQRFNQEYFKLQRQIKIMGQSYENDILLIHQEFNKKYAQLNIKYGKLLAQNNNLQEKYSERERLFQQNQNRSEQMRDKQGQASQDDKEDEMMLQGYQLSRNDNTSINESTIQTINDLLKKYEKEFNRFASLYESEIKKTRQFQHSSYQHNDHESIEAALHRQLQSLQQILSQNKQTIQLLSAQLREKELQIRTQRDNYETNQQISEQRLVQLEKRLNSLNSELQTLQRKSLQNLSEDQQISLQQPSVLITVLTAKNQEIESLKQKLQQQKLALIEKTKELSLLQNNINDQRSQLDIEQFTAFKKLVEENDLVEILGKTFKLLTQQQSLPQ